MRQRQRQVGRVKNIAADRQGGSEEREKRKERGGKKEK